MVCPVSRLESMSIFQSSTILVPFGLFSLNVVFFYSFS